MTQQETVRDAVVRPHRRWSSSTSPRKRCDAGSHGKVYSPRRSMRRSATTSGAGNLTALRELALLWVADQVDAALAKYRAEKRSPTRGKHANASSSP
ncbi:hypothetical protein GTA09_02320 [Rhodococcus hoagii]|nr:hypothetical protein [Prescottella equi]